MSTIWRERKRLWCGLPWTFTVYSFDEERFFIESGFLNKKEEEVRLYRVLDLSVSRNFLQRIFGLGTIHLRTSDKSLGDFDIVNIKNVKDVKEKLSQLVEEQRDKKRVSTREFMGGMDVDDTDDLDDDVID